MIVSSPDLVRPAPFFWADVKHEGGAAFAPSESGALPRNARFDGSLVGSVNFGTGNYAVAYVQKAPTAILRVINNLSAPPQ